MIEAVNEKHANVGSGWEASSAARAGILMGVARWLESQLVEGLVGFDGEGGARVGSTAKRAYVQHSAGR